MNEKVKRLNKLTDEFDELNGKINRLSDFINSIHFEDVVEDVKEQNLMTGQFLAMCNYRANLKARIRILRDQIQRDREIPPIQVMHDPSFDDANHCGQDTRHRDEAAKKLCDLLVKGRMIVFAPGKKCDKCGGNMFEGFGEEEGGKILCFNCASQITNEELQQALDEYRSACLHHCGQDASCPVGGGCATVQDPNESQPEDTHVSLNDLLGMEVISVGDMPCDACNPDNYAGRPCVKVELVGGTYLCLAPLPNSIITE